MDTDTYIKKIAEDIIWICNNEDLSDTEWQEHILNEVQDIITRINQHRIRAKIKASLKV
jgi:hypothetical protein